MTNDADEEFTEAERPSTRMRMAALDAQLHAITQQSFEQIADQAVRLERLEEEVRTLRWHVGFLIGALGFCVVVFALHVTGH
jgi:hypothetical protein